MSIEIAKEARRHYVDSKGIEHGSVVGQFEWMQKQFYSSLS